MKKLLMGNEAIAWGAVAAGLRVAAAYPGTPSTEIMETLVVLARERGFYVEWSANEKVALEVAAGAAYSGARAMVSMKQVGLNVAADPLMSLAYIGVRGGLLLVVADDPGPHSSQTEQDTRRFAQFAKLPVLDPADPQEAHDMARAAFDISESLGLPVILRPTTRVAHGRADVKVAKDPPPAGGRTYFEKNPRWVIFPGLAARRHVWLNGQQQEARKIFAATPFNFAAGEGDQAAPGGSGPVPGVPGPTRGGPGPLADDPGQPPAGPEAAVIACGVSYNYVREALDLLGRKLPVFKVGTPYPLPPDRITGLLEQARRVLVVEEQEPVVEDQVAALARQLSLPVAVSGKNDGLVPREGEFNVDLVSAVLARFLGAGQARPGAGPAAGPPPLPVRPPVLCAGCPHRASFYAFKKATEGMDAVFTGDIGCYTLGNAPPLSAVDTCLCMGASVSVAAGLYRADPGRKYVAFLGDSTFFHSGIAGLINAVYNRAPVTLAVLDNRTTAMTGHQPHPGLGRTALGEAREPLDIARLAGACGAGLVRVVDPCELDLAVEAAREAVGHPGPSVVVMRRECVKLAKPVRAGRIDPEECVNCRVCLEELGCPAIIPGPDRPVITGGCSGCGLCARVCPAGAIEVAPL